MLLNLTKTDQIRIIWDSSEFSFNKKLHFDAFHENFMFSHQVKSTDMQNILMKILFKLAEEKKRNKNSCWSQCSCVSVSTSICFSISVGRTKNKHNKPLKGFLWEIKILIGQDRPACQCQHSSRRSDVCATSRLLWAGREQWCCHSRTWQNPTPVNLLQAWQKHRHCTL